MMFRTECNSCYGEGTKITNPCETCRGKGTAYNKVQEQIKIPRGVDNGVNLKFRGKGHMGADLLIKIGVRRHASITREGNDAKSEKNISVVDAVLGC